MCECWLFVVSAELVCLCDMFCECMEVSSSRFVCARHHSARFERLCDVIADNGLRICVRVCVCACARVCVFVFVFVCG